MEAATHDALHVSPELAEELAQRDPRHRLVQLRLELRGALLRIGDRIDVLVDETSNEVVSGSLLVVGHDPERRWATVMVHEDHSALLVALPTPAHARLSIHGAEPCCPEEIDDDLPPAERRLHELRHP